MDNDVFEDDVSNDDELQLASKEIKQKLNSIETVKYKRFRPQKYCDMIVFIFRRPFMKDLKVHEKKACN